MQEASKKEGNKQSQLAALCKKQEAFVVEDIAREQRKRARAALLAAKKKERMEARSVCISHADLEELCAGPSERFGQEQSVADRCANMMEAVTAYFLNSEAPEGVRWKRGDGASKSAIKKGGAADAYRKLVAMFENEQKPWHWGAKLEREARAAEEPVQGA
jgi:hypothetical protein